MNSFEAVPPVRRFTWTDENTVQANTEMKAAFAEDGYLICDGFAAAQECSEMIAQADRLIDAFDETADQVIFQHLASRTRQIIFMDSASQISCFWKRGR